MAGACSVAIFVRSCLRLAERYRLIYALITHSSCRLAMSDSGEGTCLCLPLVKIHVSSSNSPLQCQYHGSLHQHHIAASTSVRIRWLVPEAWQSERACGPPIIHVIIVYSCWRSGMFSNTRVVFVTSGLRWRLMVFADLSLSGMSAWTNQLMTSLMKMDTWLATLCLGRRTTQRLPLQLLRLLWPATHLLLEWRCCSSLNWLRLATGISIRLCCS